MITFLFPMKKKNQEVMSAAGKCAMKRRQGDRALKREKVKGHGRGEELRSGSVLILVSLCSHQHWHVGVLGSDTMGLAVPCRVHIHP